MISLERSACSIAKLIVKEISNALVFELLIIKVNVGIDHPIIHVHIRHILATYI